MFLTFTLMQHNFKSFQIFAERFIESTTEINWLAIVTFSNNAYVLLHMTQMDQRGKVRIFSCKISYINLKLIYAFETRL